MKNTGSIVSIIVVCLIGLSVVLLASLRKKPKLVQTQAIADVRQSPDSADLQEPSEPPAYYPEVSTVTVDLGRLIVGVDDGLYVVPSVADEAEPQRRELGVEFRHLNIIMPRGDYRYIGANGLYLLDDNYASVIDYLDYGDVVYSLIEFGEGILVGTSDGLWYHCDLPGVPYDCLDSLLMEGKIVTAIAEDREGLWAGTYGDGLYRFDGEKWQERFLLRDTLIFSFVNALEYSYPFLWVGTDEAIFRYDGGRWAQMFVADSSEAYNVTCIMTTPAATYIGTDDGLLRFASDSLRIVEGFEGMTIAGLCRSERGVIVATRDDGIFTFDGKEEIVSPEELLPPPFGGADEPKEVIAETSSGNPPEKADF